LLEKRLFCFFAFCDDVNMKKGGWSKRGGATVVKKKRGVGKNYYVELFGEILAITKMGNSGLLPKWETRG
jgi:hypothetical protein